ncbi:MAG: GatB/YqeY domain-containing protein [Burkholderiaceae bacterium]|nr:GatB/YqeY domain-containing protein [Burkholderiaceae bacterium]
MPTRTLKDRIQDDIKDAMRERAADRLLALRGLMAAIKQREVDDRTTLDDAGVVALIDKLVKQRRDSIAAFRQGGRDDLVAKEEAEVALLQAYLPERLSTDAVAAEVAMLVSELGATGAADMGRVMAAAKARFAGRAEMGAVSAAVKAALARSAAP